MRVRTSILVAIAALLTAAAPPAAAQTPMPAPMATDSSRPNSGWALTPTIVMGGTFDDNVLIHSEGDATSGDFIMVLNPRGTAEYNGRRSQFSLNYDGAFLMYRDFNSLNSFDQHGGLAFSRMFSKHATFFVRDSAAITPTTAAVEFVGVPFVRTGSKINDLHTGVDVALTKRTSISAAYTSEWVAFDDTNAFAQLLHGGHSYGGTATLKHQKSARVTVVGNYEYLRSTVNVVNDVFDIQTGLLGFEYRLTDLTTVSGGAGFSHLALSNLGPSRTGPAFHAGITRQFRKAGLDASYSRSFVPSYGIGGTMENEELIGRARMPISRRLYTQASLAWRRNEPLVQTELKLKSWWVNGGVGYMFTPTIRLEGFYNGSRQTIDRPGGTLDRNQIGAQVIVTQPVRIR